MRALLSGAKAGEAEARSDQHLARAVLDAAAARGLEASEPGEVRRPYLARKTRAELVREADLLLRQPGWTNIWTQPIFNRVEMLATGIRTQVGVKVLGQDLGQLDAVAAQVAATLRRVPGAADVFADQSVAQPYLEVRLDRAAAGRAGVSPGEVEESLEAAVGGKVVGTALDGRRRLPVRVRYAPDFRADVDGIGQVLVGDRAPVPLAQVAALRLVEGPTMIRGEHGLLAAYVQLNVRGRDLGGFMEEAQRAVASQVRVPEGVALEWGGQYEHQLSARRTLAFVLPAVVALIFLILFLTWKDAGDAALLLLTVPGALVGGLVLQWLLGHPFSVAVWVGYIACFGLATETGIIVLTYMREALQRRGGLAGIESEAELEAAVLEGAVQRLRPKLLTEGVIILSLLPMLWATGVGAEFLRPMAAPVLGGILVADEVVDLSIPALFFWLRRRRWRALQRAGGTGSTAALPAVQPGAPTAPAPITG
jgi:Cu(I)/Ag(I) efflux system membrane protein CusA/SilA